MRIAGSAAVAAFGAGLLSAGAHLSAATDLSQESQIIWVITGIAAGGTVITFAFLVYALLRFRDPSTKGKRYG